MSNITFDVVKHTAQKMGIAVSRYPPPGSFLRHLREYLLHMEINVVLDVGANIGNYAKMVREIGYKGKIISFEPVPATFKQLHEAMRDDPHWFGEPFGLSDENREALINTYSNGEFNSLLSIRSYAEQAFSLDHERQSKLAIQLKRLDDVLPELINGIQAPRIFMKVDTQGHDVSVIKGASGVMEMIVGLQSELPAVQLYDGMSSMPDALNYYASYGFVPTGFYPLNTFRNLQLSPEFDVMFTRFEGKLSV
jgi:FkbM family methyltransferase